MQDGNWDILRFILAVADSGSAVGAAAKLGVNATTVQRKITRFEQEQGIRLFDRRQHGYTPTIECAALVEAAREVDERISSIGRDILGRDLRLEGLLRITTTDTLMHTVLPPHLATFRAANPKIHLDIVVTNSRLSLNRQDADVAIRPSVNPPENLVGQRVSGLGFAIYRSASLKIRGGRSLRHMNWIGIGDELADSPIGLWYQQHVPAQNIVVKADSNTALAGLVQAGCGVALLPRCIGDRTPGLQTVPLNVEPLQAAIWVLTHADIRQAAKVKAFTDFISRALRRDRDVLEGGSAN